MAEVNVSVIKYFIRRGLRELGLGRCKYNCLPSWTRIENLKKNINEYFLWKTLPMIPEGKCIFRMTLNDWIGWSFILYSHWPSSCPTKSFSLFIAETVKARGAEMLPVGLRFAGMCSTVIEVTMTGLASLIVRWPLAPSKAQQLPGVVLSSIARVGLFWKCITVRPRIFQYRLLSGFDAVQRCSRIEPPLDDSA